MTNKQSEINNGFAAAAMLAAGIGSLFLGIMTSLSEASKAIEGILNFYDPVGALAGKTSIAILAWLVSWAILAAMWRNRSIDIGKVLKSTYILIGLGWLGTFPLFFGLL